jgi:sugar lactone lactonase YvrE
LFVANCGADNVLSIAPGGETTVLADSPAFACPNGITLDEAGNVYVLTFGGGRVIQIAPDGDTHELARLPGGNGGHLLYHDGLLYVVSRGSNQVFTLSLDGSLTVLAGTGERGHVDGLASSATFSLPNDLIFSPDGRRLYVNEVVPVSGNANLPSAIRVIELPRGG